MDTGRIRGIAISNECNLLVRLSSTDSLIHGRYGRLSASVVGNVIGGNLKRRGRDKEEDIVVLAHDLDISLIACAYRVYRSFMLEIKGMAVESSGRSVVENGLIRDLDIKNSSQDEGSFSGSNGKGHVESKDKTEDIGSIVDFREVHHRLVRHRVREFLRFIVVFSVLITELELGAEFFLNKTLLRVQLIKGL